LKGEIHRQSNQKETEAFNPQNEHKQAAKDLTTLSLMKEKQE
jgi:hypothetical protein